MECEESFSALSTLGGAYSALGDYHLRFANVAGKISSRQFEIALRLGDPFMAVRCYLFVALSLIQKERFKKASRIVNCIRSWSSSPVVADQDPRLFRMCEGIRRKLQDERALALAFR